MIYNFVQYLKNQFPGETIFTNGVFVPAGDQAVPDRYILVTETGGPEQPWIQDVNKTVQIITRDAMAARARKLAWDIYEEITSRFGLILPLVIVDGVTYNEVETSQINAIQEPFYLGEDETSRPEFTTNYQIIYRRV